MDWYFQAETVAKTLKETIEAYKDLDKSKKVIKDDSTVEDMVVEDKEDGEWIEYKSSSKRKKNSVKKNETEKNEYKCNTCGKVFPSNDNLEEHKLGHGKTNVVACKECEKTFSTNDDLEEHKLNHEIRIDSGEHQCNKCDKAYETMSKLRRHDWRSHREVDCSICGDILASRQEIGCHRQNKHQLFRIASCKFYPNCIDGSECFFQA